VVVVLVVGGTVVVVVLVVGGTVVVVVLVVGGTVVVVVVVVGASVVVVVDVVVVEPLPGPTVKNDVAATESPSESVTVKRADWAPAAKVFSTDTPVAVVPSLKSQL
jgi:hypothetical protein